MLLRLNIFPSRTRVGLIVPSLSIMILTCLLLIRVPSLLVAFPVTTPLALIIVTALVSLLVLLRHRAASSRAAFLCISL